MTVFAAEGPHNVNDHGSTGGDELIVTMAGVMATPGSNNLYLGGDHLVVWGPEHAATLARDGWDVPMIQEALYERAVVPVSTVSAGKQAEFSALGLEPEGGLLPGRPRPGQLSRWRSREAGGSTRSGFLLSARAECVSRRVANTPTSR